MPLDVNPYHPTKAEASVPRKNCLGAYPSLAWSLSRWDLWIVPVLVTFFLVLMASAVEIEMERRGTVAQQPVVRHILINYGLAAAAIAAAFSFPFTIAVLTFARSAFVFASGAEERKLNAPHR